MYICNWRERERMHEKEGELFNNVQGNRSNIFILQCYTIL